MAGATNKAMKAAGLPKATQAQIRVTRGAGLTVQSAIQHAQAHGLPLGKAAQRAKPITGWDKAAAGAKVAPAPPRAAAPVDRRAALHAAMASRRGVVAGSLGIAGKAALAQRRDLASREAPVDRSTPAGARLTNHDYAARGGRFLERKHGLSRKESEALVLHPNTSEIQAYHHDKVKAMRVDVQSPLAHGLLRDLVSGKEKLPAKYQAMAEARHKAKRDANERWAEIGKARDAKPRRPAPGSAPSFDKARNADRRSALRSKVQDRAQTLGGKVSVLRSALATAEAGRSKQYATSEPQWSDIRGKNRQEREKKFDRAKREWNRPTRRARKIAALVESGQKKVNRLLASESRLTGAIKRVRGE